MPPCIPKSNWPSLKKHVGDLADLFPRIECNDRDRDLEEILRTHLKPHNYDELDGDLIEASRRLREAVKHDAFLRWTKQDQTKILRVFKNIKKLNASLGKLEASAFKMIWHVSFDPENSYHNLGQLQRELDHILSDRDKILDALNDDPYSTDKRLATRAISLIERLNEAWKIITKSEPNIYQSSGDATNTPPFQNCLQAIGEHLNIAQYHNGRQFNARSAIAAYNKKPPPDDRLI